MRWWSEARERARALLFRRRVDTETEEEMRFHLEMEAAHREREAGLDAEEARRQAAVAFGGVDKHGEQVRDARGLGWVNGFSLDVKLGARMLAKYPGLTLAGGLALAIAVALAASWFEFLGDMTHPRLPLEAGDRIVSIENFDRTAGEPDRRSLRDFADWRGSVRTVRELSAWSDVTYGVSTDDGRFATLRGARTTATGLSLVRVQPLLGRLLTEADEEDGSQLAVVIGHRAWQELYDGDRNVIGRTLHVGDTPGTVVGVMPEGFGFPINHEVWVPLRDRASVLERRAGPPVLIFGRLADGATLGEANAEVRALGERMAAAHPATHEHLRPRVQRITDQVAMTSLVQLVNVPFILFLIVVCANIATLVYARTATRSAELALRSALGASRRRLVLQLVAEALVLTSVATAVGLAAANWGTKHAMALFWEVQQSYPPYWFDSALSARTIIYAIVLTVLAALIIGGIPALKATGRQLRPRLAEGTGAGALRFGRASTLVIVVQVALCVAFLPVAFMRGRDMMPDRATEGRFPARDYLSGRVLVQTSSASNGGTADDSMAGARAAALYARVKLRLAEEPGVTAAAFVSRLPGFNHPVETINLAADTAKAYDVRVVGVDRDFFDIVNATLVAGRSFAPAEYESGAAVLIVDADWARKQLPGRSPIGERIRFPDRRDAEATRWHEIVGVVEGVRSAVGPGSTVGLFEPLRLDRHASLQVYLRTATPPGTLMRQVHAAVTDIDPTLAVDQLNPLDETWRPVLKSAGYFIAGLNVVAFIIVSFALIGIYALMSFTVAQRAREIAIRAALGADSRSIIGSIFSRALLQIGIGILAGAAVVSIGVARSLQTFSLVAAVAGLMMIVGLAGCGIPVFRALRIQPTEALKAE
jgi:putative ABC transport system permease protein